MPTKRIGHSPENGAVALRTSISKQRKQRPRALAALGFAATLAFLTASPHAQEGRQDYPTVAIADYIFGCMATNGQTREALERCSCSVDVVASILPYDQFVEAETVARMSQLSGEKGTLFRTGVEPKEAIARLKRAQAEAEIRCF
jgi:hypothetical protein